MRLAILTTTLLGGAVGWPLGSTVSEAPCLDTCYEPALEYDECFHTCCCDNPDEYACFKHTGADKRAQCRPRRSQDDDQGTCVDTGEWKCPASWIPGGVEPTMQKRAPPPPKSKDSSGAADKLALMAVPCTKPTAAYHDCFDAGARCCEDPKFACLKRVNRLYAQCRPLRTHSSEDDPTTCVDTNDHEWQCPETWLPVVASMEAEKGHPIERKSKTKTAAVPWVYTIQTDGDENAIQTDGHALGAKCHSLDCTYGSDETAGDSPGGGSVAVLVVLALLAGGVAWALWVRRSRAGAASGVAAKDRASGRRLSEEMPDLDAVDAVVDQAVEEAHEKLKKKKEKGERKERKERLRSEKLMDGTPEGHEGKLPNVEREQGLPAGSALSEALSRLPATTRGAAAKREGVVELPHAPPLSHVSSGSVDLEGVYTED